MRRAALVVALLLAGGGAAAQDPSFRLVNGGQVPIVEVRASVVTDEAWGAMVFP